MSVENLPVVWMAYNKYFITAEKSMLLIGDLHDGQIDVCRLVAMVIWSSTWNVANRDQNVPVGSAPTDTIGPRSRSRSSPRYVLVVLKWRKNRIIFKPRRVFSFDFVQSDSFLYFYASQPTSTIVRRLRVNPTTHDWLRLSWTCPWPSKICPSCESPIRLFPRKRLTIVLVGWPA